jgi:hypothetical protein
MASTRPAESRRKIRSPRGAPRRKKRSGPSGSSSSRWPAPRRPNRWSPSRSTTYFNLGEFCSDPSVAGGADGHGRAGTVWHTDPVGMRQIKRHCRGTTRRGNRRRQERRQENRSHDISPLVVAAPAGLAEPRTRAAEPYAKSNPLMRLTKPQPTIRNVKIPGRASSRCPTPS